MEVQICLVVLSGEPLDGPPLRRRRVRCCADSMSRSRVAESCRRRACRRMRRRACPGHTVHCRQPPFYKKNHIYVERPPCEQLCSNRKTDEMVSAGLRLVVQQCPTADLWRVCDTFVTT